jgi:NitT/TauT family transport system substrate-binding protein/sulfonate transport system substrate-binding protein
MLSRHARSGLVLSVLSLLALVAAPAGTASASSTFTLHAGFITSVSTLPDGPEGWAYSSGALLAGLEPVGVSSIQWIPFQNGPDLSAAIAGGSVDVGVLGDTPAVTAKADGIPTRLVDISFVGLDAWLFTPKHGAKTIADLTGKTVATAVGSYMYRYLVGLLAEHGLAHKVTIASIYPNDALASLQSGQIAAYAAPVGILTAKLQSLGYPVLDKASVDNRQLLGSDVTVITASALAAHPTLPSAWDAVVSKTIVKIQADPSAYDAFAAKVDDVTPAVIQIQEPASDYQVNPFAPSSVKQLQGTDNFLLQAGVIKKAVDLAAWEA